MSTDNIMVLISQLNSI